MDGAVKTESPSLASAQLLVQDTSVEAISKDHQLRVPREHDFSTVVENETCEHKWTEHSCTKTFFNSEQLSNIEQDPCFQQWDCKV